MMKLSIATELYTLVGRPKVNLLHIEKEQKGLGSRLQQQLPPGP